MLSRCDSFCGLLELLCKGSHFADLLASLDHWSSLHVSEGCILAGKQLQPSSHDSDSRRGHLFQRLLQPHEPCFHRMDLACFPTIRSWLYSRLWPMCCHRRQYLAPLLSTRNDATSSDWTGRRDNTRNGVDQSHVLHLLRKHICQ